MLFKHAKEVLEHSSRTAMGPYKWLHSTSVAILFKMHKLPSFHAAKIHVGARFSSASADLASGLSEL